MEAHHASLGRRTLEEIRQKRAAEKLSKASSGSDLNASDQYGIQKSVSASQISEKELLGLLYQIKDLEKKNEELQNENRKLASKIEVKDAEKESLNKRLMDLEESSLPSLRKALRDVQIEKDAAFVAREDLAAQLRLVKKRLKEAEDEQYRAEEDAAALRAEINSLQEQLIGNPLHGVQSISKQNEQVQAMEKEITDLRSMLKEESLLRQQEQHRWAEEQLRFSSLMAEKKDLVDKLLMSREASEQAVEEAVRNTVSVQDKEKLEKQLHDMAVMIERLESGRQKLLTEIDSQSSEIERLFEENTYLLASYQDAIGVVGQWENQVQDCLKQNEVLRATLDKLRSEQANESLASARRVHTDERLNGGDSSELLSLKGLLAKEQSISEALSAEVLQLSAQLKHLVQAYNNLTRIYKPVLRNIENNLLKMKQDGFVSVQ